MSQKPVHVRIVMPISTTGFRNDEMLKPLESPGVVLSWSQIEKGPGSIESAYEWAMSAPDTIAKIIDAEREGVDAVVIDCMGDPAMHAARETVTIPVLGPGQTGMHVAAMLGHKFSIITVMRRLRSQFENAAATTGLSGKLVSVRSVDIPVLELENDLESTTKALVDQAQLAIDIDGAEAVVFGCTGLLGCAAGVREGLLARGYDIPVIDPIPTAVNVAAALVRSKLSHSKYTYPLPPEKAMPGYDMPDMHPMAAE